MKLIRTRTDATPATTSETPPRHTWKLLVVDDEPDMRALTRINLKGFRFAERDLEILEAASAREAQELLKSHPDIAVALVDVVMETDDAGLKLVEHIRQKLDNKMIRLVIRTGQPGVAPERYVIDNFDIDDYKDKTELTATRLYTTVRSAIKAYRDLKTIDLNRIGLAQVLAAAPELYRISSSSLNNFFEGVLTQIVGLCHLADMSFISTIDGLIATFDGREVMIQATTGPVTDQQRFEEIRRECVDAVTHGNLPEKIRQRGMVIPLTLGVQPVGFVYVEPTRELAPGDLDLLKVMAQQCSSALENLRLHLNLKTAYDNAIDMLAEIAEFKDKTTGQHIQRIDAYTRLVAVELGISEDEAALYGKASRLHDVGKIGIPDEILRKRGKLTVGEFEVMKTHVTIGASILSHDPSLAMAREVAQSHHERWDGTGYPHGLSGEDIPVLARVCAIADVFDALTSTRPYKHPWTFEEAIDYLHEGAGSNFDPGAVAAFDRALPEILRIRELYRDDIIDPNQIINLPESVYRPNGWVAWDESLSVGIDVIDEHHRYLFDLTNELFDVVNAKRGSRDVARVLKALEQYAQVHFRAEERMMAHHAYGEQDRQHAQHRDFEIKLDQFYGELHDNPLTARFDVLIYLRDWLIKHIKLEDAKLKELVTAS